MEEEKHVTQEEEEEGKVEVVEKVIYEAPEEMPTGLRALYRNAIESQWNFFRETPIVDIHSAMFNFRNSFYDFSVYPVLMSLMCMLVHYLRRVDDEVYSVYYTFAASIVQSNLFVLFINLCFIARGVKYDERGITIRANAKAMICIAAALAFGSFYLMHESSECVVTTAGEVIGCTGYYFFMLKVRIFLIVNFFVFALHAMLDTIHTFVLRYCPQN
jgi:hypothetical protein